MKVTKFGHSCLLVEEGGVSILTDLGSWNSEVPDVSNLDAVLITHEHSDHFDIEKLKVLLTNNPQAQVITHASVGEKLRNANVAFTPIEPGESVEIQEVSVESFGTDHAIIYGATPPCRNTGFLIANRLYMPGDALHDVPSHQVDILALPTGGPWMKISEAVDYAKKLSPKAVFPIHDAMYTESVRESSIPRWIGTPLEEAGIRFVNMGIGSVEDFK